VSVSHLRIEQQLLQRIREHCLEEKPVEACGILTGKAGHVLHAYATDNLSRSPVYYQVDPDQQGEILQLMEKRGEELVGIYHSHPTTEARPSRNDIQLAVHYPEAMRVIISLAGRIDMRAYVIQKGQVTEIPIQAEGSQIGEWHDLRGGRPASI
jgi:[CysO sulfur-carrier protein]-S-L-cysteine hydrolase